MKYSNPICIGNTQSENSSKWVEYLREELYTCALFALFLGQTFIVDARNQTLD